MNNRVGHVANERHLLLMDPVIHEFPGRSLEVDNDRLKESLYRAGHLSQIADQGGSWDAGYGTRGLGFCAERPAVVCQHTNFTEIFALVALANIDVPAVGNLLAESNRSFEDEVN